MRFDLADLSLFRHVVEAGSITHGAERAVRTEHAGMLMDWMRAAYDRLRAAVVVEAV